MIFTWSIFNIINFISNYISYIKIIGTTFKTDDEKLQRKINKINKKPWEQEVRDEQDRRRFHGAFTGGFLAGYFNKDGSKEWCTPSTFVSLRDKGEDISKQLVYDYIDEEDIKYQVGIYDIVLKTEFKFLSLDTIEKSIIQANLP